MRISKLLSVSACSLLLGSAGMAQQNALVGQGAVVRALDRVNGKTIDFEFFPGETKQIGSLQIDVFECRYPAGNPSGDAFIRLDIREIGATRLLFMGWMIASSPAISALDHPRYDVWALRCIIS